MKSLRLSDHSFQAPWMWHPRLILKDQRDVVLAKKVKQPGFQPVFVSDLNRESTPTGAR